MNFARVDALSQGDLLAIAEVDDVAWVICDANPIGLVAKAKADAPDRLAERNAGGDLAAIHQRHEVLRTTKRERIILRCASDSGFADARSGARNPERVSDRAKGNLARNRPVVDGFKVLGSDRASGRQKLSFGRVVVRVVHHRDRSGQVVITAEKNRVSHGNARAASGAQE